MNVADVVLFIEANHVRSVAEFGCGEPSAQFAHLPIKYSWHDLRPKLVAHLRASFNSALVDADYGDIQPADLCVVPALHEWPPETVRQVVEALNYTQKFKHLLCCDIV
jgi:hypothetical protein